MSAEMELQPYTYNAVVRSVHDGDTIHADIDLGMGVWKRTENSVPGVLLRLAGCNARELTEPGGPEARDHLASILPSGTQVVLHTVKPDKFGGRYDAVVQLPDGSDLVTALIAEQWAAPWDGTGERPVPPWPRVVSTSDTQQKGWSYEGGHRARHEAVGSTIHIRLGPEVPWDQLNAIEDAVIDVVCEWPRDGWDAVIYGLTTVQQEELASRWRIRSGARTSAQESDRLYALAESKRVSNTYGAS